MSLHIYRSVDEVPSEVRVVSNNDLFFDAKTLIKNTDLVSDILSTIDMACYNSELTFIGRTEELGALNKSMLSTGTKTLLNIIAYPDRCFNVVECGQNVLSFIPKIHQGIILWRYPFVAYYGDKECDIVCHGRTFNDFYEFLDFVAEEFK